MTGNDLLIVELLFLAVTLKKAGADSGRHWRAYATTEGSRIELFFIDFNL